MLLFAEVCTANFSISSSDAKKLNSLFGKDKDSKEFKFQVQTADQRCSLRQ